MSTTPSSGPTRSRAPLLSKDGVLSVEAIDVMQTTLIEYKAQKQRVPTADLYTAEFTPVRV